MAGSAHHHGCRCKLKRSKGGRGDYLPVCERANGSEGGTRGLENPRMPPSHARPLGGGWGVGGLGQKGWLGIATWEGRQTRFSYMMMMKTLAINYPCCCHPSSRLAGLLPG